MKISGVWRRGFFRTDFADSQDAAEYSNSLDTLTPVRLEPIFLSDISRYWRRGLFRAFCQDDADYSDTQDAADYSDTLDSPIPVRLAPIFLNRKISGYKRHGLFHVQHAEACSDTLDSPIPGRLVPIFTSEKTRPTPFIRA